MPGARDRTRANRVHSQLLPELAPAFEIGHRCNVIAAVPDTPLHRLSALGQSVWIDFLSRDLLETGELERMMRDDAVCGVTSNPTIFQKAMSEGPRYDQQLRELTSDGLAAREIFFELAGSDVTLACDLMRSVWDGGAGLRGYVSIEVDPTLAYGTDATREQALELHERIDRPNLYVKIPGTEAGLPAVEDMIAAGRSINVTLIFSLERHRQVMDAYIHGLERLVAAGGDPSSVSSVASYFVSRVDTEADKRLEAIGGHDDLKGQLAVANAKLAYRQWKDAFSGGRWDELAAAGASKQWCLWASTSTKDPAYSDVLYVEALIGPETINTMPEETIVAFQDHGRAELTIEDGVDVAQELLRRLAEAGVDYDDVTATLEREGVQKFSDSFAEALEGIRAKQGAPSAA
jgi:transaldolase